MKRLIIALSLLIGVTSSCQSNYENTDIGPKYFNKNLPDSLKRVAEDYYYEYKTIKGGEKIPVELHITNVDGIDHLFLLYDDGSVMGHIKIKNGDRIFVREYQKNGMIQCDFTQRPDGVFHGEYRCYHEDGTIRVIGNYENGEEVGEAKNFDEDGNLIEPQ